MHDPGEFVAVHWNEGHRRSAQKILNIVERSPSPIDAFMGLILALWTLRKGGGWRDDDFLMLVKETLNQLAAVGGAKH